MNGFIAGLGDLDKDDLIVIFDFYESLKKDTNLRNFDENKKSIAAINAVKHALSKNFPVLTMARLRESISGTIIGDY